MLKGLQKWIALAYAFLPVFSLAGCIVQNPPLVPTPPAAIVKYATFNDQVSGIAISQQGRVFVSFPAWDGNPTYRLAEVGANGSLRPYPNKGDDLHLVAVQSLFVDAKNILWALDAPAPFSANLPSTGAKLVGVELGSDRIKKVIRLDTAVVPGKSFLRRVCVDQWQTFAYISDAGTGAILVTDLNSGLTRRVLAEHPSTKAEPGVVLKTGGVELRDPQGTPVHFDVDGLALDKESANLYYHALTGRVLYRIQTRYLNDPTVSPQDLARHVERLTDTGIIEGLAMGSDYDLYLTAPEARSIWRYRVFQDSLVLVAHDDNAGWLDSISSAPDDTLYVTGSQFDRLPYFNTGKDKRVAPYTLFRILLLGSSPRK